MSKEIVGRGTIEEDSPSKHIEVLELLFVENLGFASARGFQDSEFVVVGEILDSLRRNACVGYDTPERRRALRCQPLSYHEVLGEVFGGR